ncbi:MAG: HAD-IA family hydrolase [Nanoarchaeota archaeon]
MIKLIIFDYDGVIVDSFSDNFEIYKKIFLELDTKIKPKNLDEFRKVYGATYKEMRKTVGIKEEDFDRVDEIYERELKKVQPKPFSKIKEVLAELSKKYKLVVVSANYSEHIKETLSAFGLLSFFDLIIGSTGSDLSSKSRLFLDALQKFKIKPHETISVGDREIDFISSKQAGINNIVLAGYGWDGVEKLKRQNPEIIADSPEEILKAIKEIDK